MIAVALTIAGSDPGGGAGIQADLKTFHQLKVFGASVITLVTVQNTQRISRVEMLDASLVGDQIDAVLEDLPPQAVKTGALGTVAIIEVIASRNFDCPIIVDPVMISTRGARLSHTDALTALRNLLVPKATLITPNLDEASMLAGVPVETRDQMKLAARRIADLGAGSILIKGGHLTGNPVDILFHQGLFTEFHSARVATKHTHGTGCTYSAAITAFLARRLTIPEAVARAKQFIHEAIATAPGLGGGNGPLNHWSDPGDSL